MEHREILHRRIFDLWLDAVFKDQEEKAAELMRICWKVVLEEADAIHGS